MEALSQDPIAIQSLSTPRVLIADDQPDVLEALRLLLKGEGHQVEAVTSPAAILQMLETQHFDLLLMDLNYTRDTTSGQEGLDLLARIQALDSTLPIVVMTAWGSIELALEAVHRGVGDFVQKPWDNKRLLTILRTQIKQGQSRRKAERLQADKKNLGRELIEAPDLPILLKLLAEHLHKASQSSAVVVFIKAPGKQTFWAAAKVGIPDEHLTRLKFESDSRLLTLLDTVVDVHEMDLPEADRLKLQRANARLLVPIRLKGELIAFLSLGSKLSGEEYDTEDLEYLVAVADQKAVVIDNVRMREQEEEFEAARDIQRGLLPKEIPQVPGYEIAGAWQPARLVGGDYFDVLKFGERHVALCVADVMGKGMPAALLMSNVQAAIKAVASPLAQPRQLCSKVNRIVSGNTDPDKFITFFYGLLDAESKRLTYRNAGHNAPILLHRDGSHLRLRVGGTPLGLVPNWSYEQGGVELATDDRLVLFTDGVTEAANSQGEEFGEERLTRLLKANRELGTRELQKAVLEAVAEFTGGDLQDDATLVVMAVQ